MAFVEVIAPNGKRRKVADYILPTLKKVGYIAAEPEEKEVQKTKEEFPEVPGEINTVLKPIGEWTKEELQQYVKENGLVIEKGTNVAGVRQKVKEHLEA